MIKDIKKALIEIDKHISFERNWEIVEWEEVECAEVKKTEITPNVSNNINWVKEKKIILPKTASFPDKKSGLYFVRTVFANKYLDKFNGTKDEKHYNFKKRIKKNEKNITLNFIPKLNKSHFIVYNGEASSVRQRVQAHFNGYNGNACLAINKRSTNSCDLVVNNSWGFTFVHLEESDFLNKDFRDKYKDLDGKGQKQVRLILEKAWRYKNGWPVLCLE